MTSCVIVTDETGTPSVIGPFNTVDDAADFANSVNFFFDDDGKCKVGLLNPIPENWTTR